MPYLSGITIYPVKSLDGLRLAEATVLPSGALMHDRRWRLIDPEGAVINAKKNARFHGVRASFNIEGIEGSGSGLNAGNNFVTLSVDECIPGDLSSLQQETFPLVPGRDGPCGWLSEALATNVLLQERFDGGFPDDRDAPGPTLISYESLQEVARWFGWNLEETRRRFRMNFELTMSKDQHSDDETDSYLSRVFQKQAFWEDFLVSPRYDLVHKTDAQQIDSADCFVDVPVLDPLLFRVGRSHFRAVGGCRRCAVPSRDSMTGSETHQFRDAFEARRRHAVSHYIDTSNWSDFFRLGVNTMLLSEPSRVLTGEVLHVEM
tara:strand:+ start:393 stop:1349 length:957 start_codon:yes stop_codon:yes gene_type:complete